MSVAEKMGLEVLAVGELVVFTIGANFARSMEFHKALQLSSDMTAAAKAAKKAAGDESRRFRVSGTLHDASADDKVEKSRRWGQALPERLNHVGVRNVGTSVALQIDKATANFHYEDALSIAQWFRVRAKEAKRNAGEGAHWSELVKS